MRLECYGASRPQHGRTQNEDAFLIQRGERPVVALCDGAGNAELAAKRVLALFGKLIAAASAEQLTDAAAWEHWIKILDSSLLGGSQSTFVGATVVGQLVVGACASDSRAYLLDREGRCQILTKGASKQHLGSGAVQPFTFRLTLNFRDTLLLLSDGAWTPLPPTFCKSP